MSCIFVVPLARFVPTHSLRHSVKKMNRNIRLKTEAGFPAQHFITNQEVLEAGLEPAVSSLGGRRLIH